MNSSSLAVDCWQHALNIARRRAPASFDQWFSSVQFEGLTNGVLSLTARDEFVRDWVKTHFLPAILADLERAQRSATQGLGSNPRLDGSSEGASYGEPQSVRVQWSVNSDIAVPVGGRGDLAEQEAQLSTREAATRETAVHDNAAREYSTRDSAAPNHLVRNTSAARGDTPRPSEANAPTRDSREATRRDPRGRPLKPAASLSAVAERVGDPINPKHTFPNFVVGPSNELAYAAAVASSGVDGPRYNPLFICGGTGLGKTHLAHSIAHRLLDDKPSSRILYVSAERFTNEFIEALQHHRMEEFRTRYRRHCDALLVDDIQFLAGREQTQEEFFHTFNALRDADKPIVVTSDKYPQELQRMPERLISRFTSGLVADVQTPALETRVAILQKKAALEGIQLEDGVAVLLAQSIKSNVRELEGTLIRLAAKSSLLGRPIDVSFTQEELSLVKPLRIESSSVQDIQRAVCGHFSLSNAELLSKDRHKSIAFARQVAMYLCRQRLKCSFPELGRAFGNRDHTTVMSACRRVESLRHRNPEVNAHLQAIESQLTSAG